MDHKTNDIHHLPIHLIVGQMVDFVLYAGTVARCSAAVAVLAQPNSPKLASTPEELFHCGGMCLRISYHVRVTGCTFF